MTLATMVHPEYLDRQNAWEKFRLIKKGGDDFIEKYVEKFSDAESTTEFDLRKNVTPVAGFAKAAVVDITNSIFQRFWAIKRKGGTDSWRAAIKGQFSGVDLQSSTMNHFIGTQILPELLAMGKVGIYVDNFSYTGNTRGENKLLHPYMYRYIAEDIRNWEYSHAEGKMKLQKVLLRVRSEEQDPKFFFIDRYVEEYRYYYIVEETGFVKCDTYDVNGAYKSTNDIQLTQIPFVILELESSLLEDIANHQVALTNLESSDISYALHSNVVFYTEQFNQAVEAARGWNEEDDTDDGSAGREIKVGSTTGRRYGKELDRPGFINPSSEPLSISMMKQDKLKEDIRSLVNLALSNTRPRFASAESKELDERGLESGLSAIGLILENAEKRLGELWVQYENGNEPVTVNYPQRYSLRSDDERRKDAKQLAESASDVPSEKFRKAIQVEIAEILLEGKIEDELLDDIIKEIRKSTSPTANPDQLRSDVEIGLISREFASLARGYPRGEAEKARKEKEEAELLRMKAQSKGFSVNDNLNARGLDNQNPEEAKKEKEKSQNPENNPDNIKRVRGEGKNNDNKLS